jgi:hypothetical protein
MWLAQNAGRAWFARLAGADLDAGAPAARIWRLIIDSNCYSHVTYVYTFGDGDRHEHCTCPDGDHRLYSHAHADGDKPHIHQNPNAGRNMLSTKSQAL